jgi:3-deoxy-D-manno-octulosonic-acid transferase
MNLFFYRLGIFLYSFLLHVAALFHPKARMFVEGRRKSFDHLEAMMKSRTGKVVWFHCASLGEFEQGRPLMEQFRTDFPNVFILLTFFSPSGYEVRKNYPVADGVAYLPVDSRKNAELFLNIVRPDLVFFVKYEFWHFYTQGLYTRKIPILSVSAIFRENQLFFKPYGTFYKDILTRFTQLFVQNNPSAALLQSIGIGQVQVAGDTRFDRVKELAQMAEEIPEAALFAENSQVMVVGSSWPADMEVLVPYINLDSDIKYIIAPHEISEQAMARMERDISLMTVRLSQATEDSLREARVLIIDNVGMLARLYRYGHYAYVGGAFGQGLHNILEAATFGMPIFFGNKNYRKFKEARELISLGCAWAVSGYEEFKKTMDEMKDESRRATVAEVTAHYVRDNTGATAIIMEYCKHLKW